MAADQRASGRKVPNVTDQTKRILDVPGLGDSARLSYAQCVVAGNLLFISGQTGIDSDYRVVSQDFEAQTRQTFANLRLALHAAGADLPDIASMTVYLTHLNRDAQTFLRIRREIMGDARAASALIGVSLLGFPDLLVEIQAIAVLPT